MKQYLQTIITTVLGFMIAVTTANGIAYDALYEVIDWLFYNSPFSYTTCEVIVSIQWIATWACIVLTVLKVVGYIFNKIKHLSKKEKEAAVNWITVD